MDNQKEIGMSKDTGGPACSRCSLPATHLQGHQHLCQKHYRFGQMRASAKRNGKVVPSHEHLAAMASESMVCPDCSVRMNWLARDGACSVATLQHYRDGTLAIVCLTCNTRHASMPGDTYRDMPKDHKLCVACNSIKPLCNFSADNSRSGVMKIKSKCRSCSDAAVNNWKELNREKYNEYQRAYRAMRKESGNPVSCGS